MIKYKVPFRITGSVVIIAKNEKEAEEQIFNDYNAADLAAQGREIEIESGEICGMVKKLEDAIEDLNKEPMVKVLKGVK